MIFEEAKRRLLAANYQLLPVQGEPYYIVFHPPDKEGNRQAEPVKQEQIIAMAEEILLPDEERRPVADIQKVGVVARLRKVPISTDSEGEPKLQIVLEVEGRGAVNSVPIESLKEMLGQLVLLQLRGVQLKFEIFKKGEGAA